MKVKSMLLTAGALIASFGWGATAEKVEKDVFRLANGRIVVLVDARQGGRVVSFRDIRTGLDYCTDPGFVANRAGSGFLCDRIEPLRGASDRTAEKDAFEIVKSESGTEAVLSLRHRGRLDIVKTIRLGDGKDTLSVDYALSNSGDKTFEGGIGVCSLVPSANVPLTIFSPYGKPHDDADMASIERGLRYDPAGGSRQANITILSPSNGVVRVCYADNRRAFRFEFPYAFLGSVYHFFPGEGFQSSTAPTVEWYSDELAIEPLSELPKFAKVHPEELDPEKFFVLRFTMSFGLENGQSPVVDRKRPSGEMKNRDFAIKDVEPEVYEDWQEPAQRFLVGPARRMKILAVNIVSAANELLEFRRRFDCDIDFVDTATTGVFLDGGTSNYYSWKPGNPEKKLRKALERKYDVFFFSGTEASMLPKDIQARILEAVEKGTGVVYVGPGYRFPFLIDHQSKDKQVFRPAGVPYAELPATLAGTYVMKRGKGTIVWANVSIDPAGLGWTQRYGLLPVEKKYDAAFPWWEYVFAWYGKLFQKAAGFEPEVRIVGLGDDGVDVIASRSGKYVVEETFDGRESSPVSVEFSQGTNHLARVGKKMSRNGVAFRTLRVNGQDYFTVAVSNQCACGGLDSFEVAKVRHDQNEPVKGVFSVHGTGVVRLSLDDAYERCLAVREYPVAGKLSVPFSLTPEADRIKDYAECRLKFLSGGRVIDERIQKVILAGARQAELQKIVWGRGINRFFERQNLLGQMGWDVYTGFGAEPLPEEVENRHLWQVAAGGMGVAPVNLHVIRLWSIPKDTRERKPCLRDPKSHAKARADAAEAFHRYGSFRPRIYYTADESSLGHYDTPHDLCTSSFCLAGFRKRMKLIYQGDLRRLNHDWETNYGSFDELMPATWAESKTAGNFKSWYFHRLFMMEAIPDELRVFHDALDKFDPTAKLGFTGQRITSLHGCFNWLDVMEFMDCPDAYSGSGDSTVDLMRTCGGGGTVAQGFTTPSEVIRASWLGTVASGLRGLYFWWSPPFFRRGDGRLTKRGQEIAAILREFDECGIEELFVRGKRRPSRIAVVYSLESFVSSACVPEVASDVNRSTWTEAFSGAGQLLRDLGLSHPDVIDARKLGKVDLSRYDALVLPMMQVVSDDQHAVLSNYVNGGGKIVSDSRYGVFDQWLNRRPSPIGFGNNRAAVEYLNCYMWLRGTGARVDGFLKNARASLSSIGLEGKVSVPDSSNYVETRVKDRRAFLFVRGKAKREGVFRFELGKALHVYDVFGHRYCGVKEALESTLSANGAAAFAAFPEKLGSFDFDVRRQGRLFELNVHSDSCMPDIVRVTVRKDGVPHPEYARTFELRSQKTLTVDPGVGAAADGWEFALQSVLTGQAAVH